MRLIDADAYCAEMKKRQDKCIDWRNEAIAKEDDELFVRADQALGTFIEARLTMAKMPTVGAVCVVRCAECKYAIPYKDVLYCNRPSEEGQIAELHSGKWYCADGRRKEANDATD